MTLDNKLMESLKQFNVMVNEIENEEKEKMEELKKKKDKIYYNIDFRDDGYAFVECLTIYDSETGEVLHEQKFLGADEAESYMDEICS